MKPQVRNSQVAGIDLGTTFTSLAFMDDVGQPKVIPNLDGDLKTPSEVYCDAKGEEILVGRAAQNMMFLEPKQVFKETKRDVGTDKVYFANGPITATPDWCQAQILKYMRESAIQYSGDKRAASEAVITVPAYFKDNERQSVIRSAERAGIKVLRLINEPTSAGLALGLSEKQGDALVLVLDFGGGTFDVSLIQYGGGKADVIASSGDKHLGGKDVDDILLKWVADQFKNEHGIEISPESCPADFYGVWEEIIRQKHLLSSRRETTLVARAQGKQVAIKITRDDLGQRVAPLMDRIKSTTLGMLRDAKVNVGDVSKVLCVGGSSRLPAFHEAVAEMLGKDKLVGGRVSPDLAVAEGAAIKAAEMVWRAGMVMVDEKLQAIPAPAIKDTDVMPHSLGVAVQDRVSDACYCSVILRKNTPLPCQASKTYSSVSADQTEFNITVLQGEDGQPADDCLTVAEKAFLLAARNPDNESVKVTMGYDESGLVNVTVEDLISGKAEDITVSFYAKT